MLRRCSLSRYRECQTQYAKKYQDVRCASGFTVQNEASRLIWSFWPTILCTAAREHMQTSAHHSVMFTITIGATDVWAEGHRSRCDEVVRVFTHCMQQKVVKVRRKTTISIWKVQFEAQASSLSCSQAYITHNPTWLPTAVFTVCECRVLFPSFTCNMNLFLHGA